MPAVFNSPHSGQLMPQSLLRLTQLSPAQLRQSEDSYVDLLFSGCLNNGAPLLRALASRSYLDLNREPFELDQRMFAECLPGYMNPGSPRVAAGLGTLPRIVGDDIEIYRAKIPLSEAFDRIESFYKPYHRTLVDLLQKAEAAAGFVLLVDCHSMPTTARQTLNAKRPDVVLGDRFGRSTSPEISNAIEAFFSSQGLRVVRNKPYAGGFITETYGAPQQHRHAVQLEISRGLYMDERTFAPLENFSKLQETLTLFSAHLNEITMEYHHAGGLRRAAE